METFKTVNGVPTKVLCYGKSIGDDLSSIQYLVLVFPGNPGVIEYYQEFMSEIHRGLSEKHPDMVIPVWGISHAGHQMDDLESSLFPDFEENQHLYNLEGQFEHKVEFAKTYIPSHIKVIGIGHSIGCKTWSELFKRMEVHKKSTFPQITKCFMLFPTLERMRSTPNGKWFTSLLPYYNFIHPFLRFVMMCPSAVHRLFLKIHFFGQNVPQMIEDGSMQIFNVNIYEKILHMARCEMDQVVDLDVATLEANLDKFFFYFGTTDGWCPLEYVDQMREKLPEMSFKICDKGIQHAFVIKCSSEMAATICSLIDVSNTN